MFDLDFLFVFANASISIVWILLVFLPRHPSSRWVLDTYNIQLILSLIYAFLILDRISNNTAGGFGSLEAIRKLFSADTALLAGWIHYLIFDSLVGTWMVHDAQKNNIPHLHIIVPLVFTFMLGPVGFLIYIFYRNIYLRRKKT
jgi:uncharacterized protein YacL